MKIEFGRKIKELWANEKKITDNYKEWKWIQDVKQRYQIQEVCSDRNTIEHRRSKHAKNICTLEWILKREYITDKGNLLRIHQRRALSQQRKKPTMYKNVEGFVVLVSEIRSASAKVNRNKMVVLTEILSAEGDFWINKITEMINEINDSGEMPEGLSL